VGRHGKAMCERSVHVSAARGRGRRAIALAVDVAAGLLSAAVLLPSGTATAGPPFRTDDPVPVEPQHWEIFAFSTATHTRSDTAGTLPGIDANYGATPNLQLHAAVPIAFDSASRSQTVFGPGDTELGLKYRFIAEDENGWRPQAAIYPLVNLPTGDPARNLGAGHVHEFLPLWVQKTVGKWTTFAGVGYGLNPGAGNRNYWYLGWTLQRQIADNLTVGGELFHQTANMVDGKDQTGFDLGVTYDLSEHYHLLLSVGQGIQNRTTTDELTYYASVQWTF
jgi:hypothetical protein